MVTVIRLLNILNRTFVDFFVECTVLMNIEKKENMGNKTGINYGGVHLP